MKTLPSRITRSIHHGFTLIEMLVVMAIIGILTALVVPALASLNSAGNMNQALVGISLSLDQARAYAMAHNTYVWVGFKSDPALKQLKMGIVAGVTGSPEDINSSATCKPISALKIFSNFNLTTVQTVQTVNSALPAIGSSGVELTTSALASFTMTAGGTSTTFSSTAPSGILQFDPAGEANVTAAGELPHWIQFGLQPSQGANNPNVAVIQVAGLSGQIQIFRP